MTTLTFIAGYVLTAVVVAAAASILGVYGKIYPATSRRCARMALLAMFWPALAVYGLYLWARYMWGLAEWGTR